MGLSEGDFRTVRSLMKQHAAIVLEPARTWLAERRLLPLARREGLDGVASLVARLRERPFGPLHEQVVDAMTAHETWFFRDLHPFEALRSAILPELIRRRQGDRALRIWCGACSSGQEAYTIAMVIHEHFPQLREWTVSLLATDLSEEMLARAHAGRFTQLEVNRGLPARLLVRYFSRCGAEWQIGDELRQRIEFRPLNLVKPWPELPAFDLVFLRNVLSHFAPETRRQVLARIRGQLRPDGHLILGAAETTLNADDAFERVAVARSWAYRLRRA